MRLIVLAALSLGVSACGGSGSSTTAPPAFLTVTLATSTIASGTRVQAVATNPDGSPASNVTWSSSNTNVATVTSAGEISGASKGSASIRATSGSSTGQATVTVVPGAPASIYIYSGDGQTAAKGAQLHDPLCTNVTDLHGNLIVGAVVTYTVQTGGGQMGQPTDPATNATGVAISGLWTLGPAAGSQKVVASSPGAGTVTFTANAQ